MLEQRKAFAIKLLPACLATILIIAIGFSKALLVMLLVVLLLVMLL
jgi:uncharacterized membrane protein